MKSFSLLSLAVLTLLAAGAFVGAAAATCSSHDDCADDEFCTTDERCDDACDCESPYNLPIGEGWCPEERCGSSSQQVDTCTRLGCDCWDWCDDDSDCGSNEECEEDQYGCSYCKIVEQSSNSGGSGKCTRHRDCDSGTYCKDDGDCADLPFCFRNHDGQSNTCPDVGTAVAMSERLDENLEGYEADFLLDQDVTTRWSAGRSTSAWFVLELVDEYALRSMTLYFPRGAVGTVSAVAVADSPTAESWTVTHSDVVVGNTEQWLFLFGGGAADDGDAGGVVVARAVRVDIASSSSASRFISVSEVTFEFRVPGAGGPVFNGDWLRVRSATPAALPGMAATAVLSLNDDDVYVAAGTSAEVVLAGSGDQVAALVMLSTGDNTGAGGRMGNFEVHASLVAEPAGPADWTLLFAGHGVADADVDGRILWAAPPDSAVATTPFALLRLRILDTVTAGRFAGLSGIRVTDDINEVPLLRGSANEERPNALVDAVSDDDDEWVARGPTGWITYVRGRRAYVPGGPLSPLTVVYIGRSDARRIREFALESSLDNVSWTVLAEGTAPEGTETLRWQGDVEATFLRFTIRSTYGNGAKWAGLAAFIPDDELDKFDGSDFLDGPFVDL